MSNSIGTSVSSTVTTNTKPINPAQAQKEADFLEQQIRSFNAQVASLKAERQLVPLGRFGTFYEEPSSVVPKIARLQKEVASDRRQLNSPALAAAAALQVAVRGSQGAINKATTLPGKAAAYQRAANAIYQAATTFENTQHHSTPWDSYDANWTAQQVTSLAPFLLTAEFDQQQADRYQTQADQAQLASLSADRKAVGAMRSFSQEDEALITARVGADSKKINAVTMQNDNAQQSLGQIADHLQLYYDIQSYTDFATDPVALLETDPYIPASVISELEAETYTD